MTGTVTGGLLDDCFAFDAPRVTLAEALALLRARIQPVVAAERLPLAEALGRVLAAAVTAALTLPPHDNSAVDGYAVAFDDLATLGETRLPLDGRVAAGHPLDRPARRGAALRIFTGALLPAGVDSIAMQEDCREEAGFVIVPAGLRRGANRRRAGEDVRAGETLLPAGRRLRPADLGLAAANGLDSLPVARRLRVALFSTGDEVVEPGRVLPPGAIYDANRTAVRALLTAQGAAVTDLGILPDRAEPIAAALAAAAAAHDLIVTSGGVSRGEEDRVKAAVLRHGSLHFWRLAIKPGQPLALGQVGRVPFVGLPGNPVSAIVTFIALVRPLLALLGGAEPAPPRGFPVTSGFAHDKKPGRQEWLRVSLAADGAGGWLANKFPRQGSGILSSLTATDGLVPLAEDLVAVAPGDRLSFIPYGEVLA